MKIEDFYKIFQFAGNRNLKKWEKNQSSDWQSEFKRFSWNKRLNGSYQKRYAPEFRQKQLDIKKHDGLKASFRRLDYMFCYFFLGAVPEDYFSMVFENKNWKWRNHHITRMRLDFIKKMLNDDDEANMFVNDKLAFCRHWNDKLNRQWCNPEDTSYDEFTRKFHGIDKIILKRRIGYGGKGIEIIKTSKISNEDIYDDLVKKHENYIIEEFHSQTGWIHKINPSSLNTIRVATVKVNDQTDVVFSYLRVGVEGAVVDNLHSGGIRFPINHHTGEIYMGMNYQTSAIESHPDSGVRIAGETIPDWDKICSFCISAHECAPESLRFIGWDVCLDENDMCLIEGNSGPGFPPIEDPDDDWWKQIKSYFSKMDKKNKKR